MEVCLSKIYGQLLFRKYFDTEVRIGKFSLQPGPLELKILPVRGTHLGDITYKVRPGCKNDHSILFKVLKSWYIYCYAFLFVFLVCIPKSVPQLTVTRVHQGISHACIKVY